LADDGARGIEGAPQPTEGDPPGSPASAIPLHEEVEPIAVRRFVGSILQHPPVPGFPGLA